MKNVLLAIVFAGLWFAPLANLDAQNCLESTSYTELEINNVKAGLQAGGDTWWDLQIGKYIVPKPAPGVDEVSAIFAGALWIAGVDPAGNLKAAAQTYRQAGNDFYPGPIINPPLQTLDCLQWDQHFKVFGAEIDAVVADFNDNGIMDDPIPTNILKWPASGNIHTFPYLGQLPFRPLAPFKDRNMNGIYEADLGDHPILGIDNCSNQYADQMIWWVFNDIGNLHGNTNGDPIGLEIQAMAYAFTDPPFDYTTFYTYDIINQSTEDFTDAYIAQWVDTDLGCWSDDYLGCDSSRSMAIAYNGATIDPDCSSFGGGIVYGYKNEVPLLGVDLLAGPKDTNGQRLPMTAFVSYITDGSPQGEPQVPSEYYSYLKGNWRDGSPIEYGGNGYQQNTFPYPFMYPHDPTDPTGWSECTESNDSGDRKFFLSSGPFHLQSGARDEITVAVIFQPDVPHPCPSFQPLQTTSDLIQNSFDNCFSAIVSNNEVVKSELLNAIKVYPNPTSNNHLITLTNVPKDARLDITTIDGKLVRTLTQNTGTTNDVIWDLTANNGNRVGRGMYLVTVRTEEKGSKVLKVSVL